MTWLESTPDLEVWPMPEVGSSVISSHKTMGERVMPVETYGINYSLRLPDDALDKWLPEDMAAGLRRLAAERLVDTVYVSPIARRQVTMLDPETGMPVKWGQAYCYVAFGTLGRSEVRDHRDGHA